jgi:hypothetical protein
VSGTQEVRVLQGSHVESELRFSKEELTNGVQIIVTDAANIKWLWRLG